MFYLKPTGTFVNDFISIYNDLLFEQSKDFLVFLFGFAIGMKVFEMLSSFWTK